MIDTSYRIPFEDENIPSLYNKICTQALKVSIWVLLHQCNIIFVQLPDEADVSAELLDLLNKMLIKTPSKR